VERAVLLVSHGTIDDLDDLPAFVTQVRRGHPPSSEVVAELRRRYQTIGGRSPLNAISAALASKLAESLKLRVAWANRLWKPYVRDVLADLGRDGVKRVAFVALAQHSAHVYAQDARQAAQGAGVVLACAPNWGDSQKLHEAFAERIMSAMAGLRDVSRATLLMTAHSLPKAVVLRGDPYEEEVRKAAEAIAEIVRGRIGHDVSANVAYQSQGLGVRGPDGKPIEWLGPDVRTVLDEAAARGDRSVVFAPIGFLADHVEILYDLDVEARAMAEERSLGYVRAASLNADDDLVDVLAGVARPLLGHG
jgi:protoporphyrin/coproporphyrin ferrochelatase